MKPITRLEQFLATAAGEYDGELPAPITRQEQYLKKIIDQIDGGGSVSPEQIDAAIEAYLNSHDADIVTEQELSDELSEYYNKTDIDNALGGKADSADIPDVSGFATTADMNTALAEKQDALTFDSAPTQNSTNPVTSGGVYTALTNVGSPTDAQVQSAVDDYLDDYLADHGIVFNTSAEITEVLHG